MSLMSDAFTALRTAHQTVTGSTPTITYSAQTVAIIPAMVGQDTSFFDGGTGNAASVTVQTLASDWSSIPAKHAVVALAGHDTAPDGNYQVMTGPEYREGTITFQLGNLDAQNG